MDNWTGIILLACCVFWAILLDVRALERAPNEADYPSPRIVIIGDDKNGTLGLMDALLGGDKNYKAPIEGCMNCTCGVGPWLGKSKSQVTIITASSHKNFMISDDFADFHNLLNQVKLVHVFGIVLDVEPNYERYHFSISIIELFVLTFGDQFWKNAIFLVPRWPYDHLSVQERLNRSVLEYMKRDEWNKLFHQKFDIDISINLDALFIDTSFDGNDPEEEQKFYEYTRKLWDFANRVSPFEPKGIKIALPELMEAQQSIDDLKSKLETAQEKLNMEYCLMWSFCFTPPQFGGFGSAMLTVGLIIGIVIVCCYQRCCTGRSSCCIPGGGTKPQKQKNDDYATVDDEEAYEAFDL